MIAAGLRILVVGAGIAGLGAARVLRQRGLATDVVEREPAWTHTGAGIYLPGNAARMGLAMRRFSQQTSRSWFRETRGGPAPPDSKLTP